MRCVTRVIVSTFSCLAACSSTGTDNANNQTSGTGETTTSAGNLSTTGAAQTSVTATTSTNPTSTGAVGSSTSQSSGGTATSGATASSTSVTSHNNSTGATGTTSTSGDETNSDASSTQASSQSTDATSGTDTSSSGPDLATAAFIPDPSWDCGVPEGLPPPEQGELVFEATLELGDVHEFGETQYGERRLLDVVGGSFTGERISGTFETGGLELELQLSNGSLELEQIDILRASDNAVIYLRTCGFAPAGEMVSRFVPDFEAPNSSAHAWLNEGKFAGTRRVDLDAGTVEWAIYDVSMLQVQEPSVQLTDPEGVPDQPWECLVLNGTRGASVLTENVTLGSSVSVGQSKRGNRNIIPITGGTVTGRLNGSIVPGGADYQLIGAQTVLDARYTLKGDDGDYVLVRNCGPFGALIPLFEARKDGPYAFLNENRFVSSDPGTGAGGVSITFYELQ